MKINPMAIPGLKEKTTIEDIASKIFGIDNGMQVHAGRLITNQVLIKYQIFIRCQVKKARLDGYLLLWFSALSSNK